jgi:hypothetical protein
MKDAKSLHRSTLELKHAMHKNGRIQLNKVNNGVDCLGHGSHVIEFRRKIKILRGDAVTQ